MTIDPRADAHVSQTTVVDRAASSAWSEVPVKQAWAEGLDSVVAKGRTVRRPGSLAGLAAARREHMGQFFTPSDVAARMWQLVAPSLDTLAGRRLASVLDNSVGSARLFQFADPEKVKLAGCDVDTDAVAAVVQAVKDAGFSAKIVASGMERCVPSGFDVALINPPFSLTIRSPHLIPGASTTYGPFGPHTSATSQWYALEQALAAASVVCALLPLQDIERLVADPVGVAGENGRRLARVYRLPAGSFRSEGTEVATGIALFGPVPHRGAVDWIGLDAELRPLALHVEVPVWTLPVRAGQAGLHVVGLSDSEPVITQPVTGDPSAELRHDGRRLVLKTWCGFTEARARNAIMGELLPAEERSGPRRPEGVRAVGHYRLDREVLLAQPDWRKALAELREKAAEHQVELTFSDSLIRHLERRSRQVARQRAPFGRVVADPDGLIADSMQTPLQGTTVRAILADRSKIGAPSIRKGVSVSVRADGLGGFVVARDKTEITLSEADLRSHVEILSGALPVGSEGAEVEDADCWHTVSDPLSSHPAVEATAAWWRARAREKGVIPSSEGGWLWDYQFEDMVDLLSKPFGAIAGWATGLGKSRLAAALALVNGGRRTAVVVPARLVPEIEAEWRTLPLPAHAEGKPGVPWWKVVRRSTDLDWDVPVLLIALEHLRAPRCRGAHKSLASMLRRRISLLILDEADILANPNSDQSRAVWNISARKRILLTATPIPNYPRDVFPLLALTAGDGTAAQSYGWYRTACDPIIWRSADVARRGKDAILADFATMTWVTPEFSDTAREGAKREIPIIRDLAGFRDTLAPAIRRRVHGEPDVARYVSVPDPVWEAPRVIQWDPAHLAHFLKVADEFADWYRRYREGMEGRASSLQMLVMRIGAVERAGNDPAHSKSPLGRASYPAPTSKQKAVVAHLVELAKAGHRAICYGRHPLALEWVAQALEAAGVGAVVLHGGRSIAGRNAELNERFRNGDASHVLATFGTGDRGLNLPQADRVVLLDRDWTSRTERQCVGRLLRPQQTEVPHVQPFHLPGSLDDYMAQMTRFKGEATDAGLDWGTPTLRPEDFLHLDTVIERFVNDLAERRGIRREHLKESYKLAG